MRLRAATRGSELALWQTRHVARLLSAVDATVELETLIVATEGDRRAEAPIAEIGGKGMFVSEVQRAVLEGRADLAVHSAKDLPSVTADGLSLASVPERGDPRDVLVGRRLDAIPNGGRVATGSLRRRAQLAHLRPDLRFFDLRGNIATRLAKSEGFDAVVMAAAALERLDQTDRAAEVLGIDVFIPQVGQGALAVECRADDEATIAALGSIEHAGTRKAVDAERAYLAELGGDCRLPAGAFAQARPDGIFLRGFIASTDGTQLHRSEQAGEDAQVVGSTLARRLLEEEGGAELLPLQ